ncbi:MAG: PmbA protein [Candidatus Atribacteria bacterium]|nr:PmbA protein [Candidatus Atribacteria bacterium]
MYELARELKSRSLEGDVFTRKIRAKEVRYQADRFAGFEIRENEGYGLRVINPEGKIAFYASSSFEESPQAVLERTLAASQYGDRVKFHIPSYPSLVDWENLVDPRVQNIKETEMIELGEYLISRIKEEYPQLLVDLTVAAGLEEKSLFNHHQEKLSYAQTFFQVGVSVNQTKEGDIVEIFSERNWGNRELDLDQFLQDILLKIELSQRISEISSGQYPVVFTPEGSITLLLPLFYGLNGKNIVFGRSPLGEKMNKVIFSPLFSLLERPKEKWALGSCPFDDEGVVTEQEKPLIEAGGLKNCWWDLWSASQKQVPPSGNGFRSSYRDLPQPNFTNLEVKNGLRDRETLIEEIEEGLIVDSVLGLGQSNIAAGYFSCNIHLGFVVRKGEIQGRVKNVMISGNIYQDLKNVKEISRDNRWVGGRMLLPYLLVDPIQVEAKN